MVYCYGVWQPRFTQMKKKGVPFHQGIPTPSQLGTLFRGQAGALLVLEDLMKEGGNDKRVLDLFTKDSHHQNITVLYLTQDLFPRENLPRPSTEVRIMSSPSRIHVIEQACRIWSCKRFPTDGKG